MSGCSWYIVFILLFAGMPAYAQETRVEMPEVGDTAAEFLLKNLNGDTVSLSQFRGDLVYLDFWASWCYNCRKEHRYYRELYTETRSLSYQDSGQFRIVSISLDTDSLTWRKAMRNDHMDWPDQLIDFRKWDSPVLHRYGVTYLPYNFLIDSNGIIVAKGLNAGELREVVLKHLK